MIIKVGLDPQFRYGVALRWKVEMLFLVKKYALMKM